jgi:NAD(P)-dependent dehydrogenase (short-subunit alcohol dehydrogenase family)
MSKVVLITGASSGIGQVTGELLAKKGHIVYGASRNIETKALPFHTLNMDVTDEDSIQSVIDHILKQ